MSAPRIGAPIARARPMRFICCHQTSSPSQCRQMATAVENKSGETKPVYPVNEFGHRRPINQPPKYKMKPKKKQGPEFKFFPEPTPRKPLPHHSFAVYNPPPRSLSSPISNPMLTLRDREIARLDPHGVRSALIDRSAKDAIKVGDVLRVTMTKGEPFAGVLMNLRRRGADTAILLRGQMDGVGVEVWYKLYSTKIVAIDVIWRSLKRARRARLTYLRKPKHDMGDVGHLVDAWFRSRITVGAAKKKKPTDEEGGRDGDKKGAKKSAGKKKKKA